MIIELPLWVVIVFIVGFALLTIHTCVGDLLGKILYNHFKNKENDDE